MTAPTAGLDEAPRDALEDHLRRLVRDVADFPTPGILFKDISPLLADHAAFAAVVEALAATGRGADGRTAVDKVVGIEARGFILAAPVALTLGAGFVPVRKAGKLPGPVHEVGYAMEYGEAVLQIQQDAVDDGERVLVVDDVLATGGTVAAARELVESCGGTVTALAVLLELGSLGGRATLSGVPLTALHVAT